MRKAIDDEVVVVAARNAYPEYLRRSVYVCQPNRSFRDGLTYMGFYANGAIQRPLPRIRYREDVVTFSHQEAASRRSDSAIDRQVGEVIELLLADGPREEGEQYEVFLLSGPEDPDTLRLDRPIMNDTVSKSARPLAWVRGQRYVSLADLTRPGVTVTSQLGANDHRRSPPLCLARPNAPAVDRDLENAQVVVRAEHLHGRQGLLAGGVPGGAGLADPLERVATLLAVVVANATAPAAAATAA